LYGRVGFILPHETSPRTASFFFSTDWDGMEWIAHGLVGPCWSFCLNRRDSL
jgi:hypothetical protein